MNIQDGYILTRLCGQDYLLPYGQNIATFKKGMKLNASGRFIWEALCAGKNEEELPALLAARYEAGEADYPQLRADIAQFLDALRGYGIVDRTSPDFYFPSGHVRTFQIGTLTLRLAFADIYIAKEFFPFEKNTATGPADLTISLRFGAPAERPAGVVLVRSADFLAIEAPDCFCLLFPGAADVIECHMDREARAACFYCKNPDSSTIADELFHGIRFVYLMRARAHGLYALHSASLVYRGQAWLFSGVSGTGKSTHTNLWQKRYGVPLLNGDLNLIGIRDDTPYAYGLPWCGTSCISTTETLPLGGIIFLRKAPLDKAEPLADDAAQLMLSQRLITPAWTKEMLLDNLAFCEALLPRITAFAMHATMDIRAAEVCRAAIDELSAGCKTYHTKE